MGFATLLNDAFTKANKPIARITSNIDAAKKSVAMARGLEISKSIASDLKTVGGISRMAVGGAAGAGAGYLYGDGDKKDIAKGAALGILGGAAWSASNNPLLRKGISDTKAWGAGLPGRAEEWAAKGAAREKEAMANERWRRRYRKTAK